MPSPLRRWMGTLITVGLAAVVVVGLALGGGGDNDRVQSITERLRCPVCQAESVAESPSTTSREMTQLVRSQVRVGRSDDEILDFFRARYGDWILLNPPRSGQTLLLWVLPPVALAVGTFVVVRQRSRVTRVAPAPVDRESAPPRKVRVPRVAIPWEGPGRRVVGVGLMAAAVALAALLVVRATEPRTPGAAVTGANPSEGNNLADVTTAELEAVVEENPKIVPMRLALVERLLTDGDTVSAHAQARTALEQATALDDRQRALTFAGWTTALVGSPTEGAALLEEGLALAPTNRDTMWYLANVRLIGLDDPAGAIPLLEDLLDTVDDGPRKLAIEARLSEARALLAVAPAAP